MSEANRQQIASQRCFSRIGCVEKAALDQGNGMAFARWWAARLRQPAPTALARAR